MLRVAGGTRGVKGAVVESHECRREKTRKTGDQRATRSQWLKEEGMKRNALVRGQKTKQGSAERDRNGRTRIGGDRCMWEGRSIQPQQSNTTPISPYSSSSPSLSSTSSSTSSLLPCPSLPILVYYDIHRPRRFPEAKHRHREVKVRKVNPVTRRVLLLQDTPLPVTRAGADEIPGSIAAS